MEVPFVAMGTVLQVPVRVALGHRSEVFLVNLPDGGTDNGAPWRCFSVDVDRRMFAQSSTKQEVLSHGH